MAVSDSGVRRVALGGELAADVVGDDLDVQGRAVSEGSLVNRGERRLLAAVKVVGELDGRVGAAAEVDVLADAELAERALGDTAGGTACLLLGVAVADRGIDLAGVGGVGAGVVLDGAGTLDGGAYIDEGRALDGERTVTRTADDGDGGGAQVTSKSIHIGASRSLSIVRGCGAAGRGLGYSTTLPVSICRDTTPALTRRFGGKPTSSIGGSIASGNTSADTSNGGSNLVFGDIGNQEVLANDAANSIIGIIASITSSSRVVQLY